MATINNPIELTVYLVGEDEDSAIESMPFDSEHSAISYARDQTWPISIYEVTAYIDPSTIEKFRSFPEDDEDE